MSWFPQSEYHEYPMPIGGAMRKNEILNELCCIPPYCTLPVPKCEEVRELEREGAIRIVAVEPFQYIIERRLS